MRETSISSAASPAERDAFYNGAGSINPYVLFLFLAVFLYFPSCFLRGLFYPDEARDIFIAKNMHTFSNFLFPHYLSGIYYQKPPFYFWIIHLLLKIPSINYLAFPVLFNVFVCFGILSVNYLFFKKEGMSGTGLLSSVLLSTTAIFYGMGVILRMDILFLFFILLSIFFLWVFIKEGKRFQLVLSALFIFLSVFTKGAFGIIFPAMAGIGSALFLKKRKALRRAVLANIIGILLVLAWLIIFDCVHHGYIKHMLFVQTLSRGINSFTHKHPFYYYLIFLIPVFLPWSFIGIGYLLFTKKRIRPSLEKMLILWLVGGFIVLSLVSSKIPMYLLLLAVPFCGLCAQFLIEGKEEHKSLFFYVTIFFIIFIFASVYFYFDVHKKFIPAAAYIAIGLFLAAALFMLKKKPIGKFRVFLVAWFIFIQLVNFIYLPLASRHYDYNNIAEFLEKADFDISKIYVDERKLLLLNAYPLKTRVVYTKNEMYFTKEKGIVFISKIQKPAHFVEAAKIGSFFIFYR